MKPMSLSAFILSLISLMIAILSLGWNVYRELALRPRLIVFLDVSVVLSENILPNTLRVILNCTNFGPGTCHCEIIKLLTYKHGWLNVLLRRTKTHGVLIHDYKSSIGSQLPKSLAVGERMSLVFPYERDCFLKDNFSKLGIQDSFGRTHWIPKKMLLRARNRYLKDFAT
jgi:hypothetical protein